MFSIEFYWLFLFCCLIFLFVNFNRELLVYTLFLLYNILFITISKLNYIDLDIQLMLQIICDVVVFGGGIHLLRDVKEILKLFSIWLLFFITNFQILFINYTLIQESLFQIDNYNIDCLCLIITSLFAQENKHHKEYL